MEVTVFGHKNTKLPLLERIQRLEKEVGFNTQELAQKDLPTQVDSLWSQVGSTNENSRSRKVKTRMVPSDSYAAGTFDESGQNWDTGQNQGTSTHESLLHKLGRTIEGALMSPSFSPYYGYGGYNPYNPYGMYGNGIYGNSYMNPYMSPWGTGYGGYYPGLGTYGWGGSPYGLGGSPFGGSPFGGSPFGGSPFIHF